MGTNTVLVQVIDQRGNRIPTVIPLYRLIDASETLDGDLWITYYGDNNVRKCQIELTAQEFNDQCNGIDRVHSAYRPLEQEHTPEIPKAKERIDFDDDIPF